MTSEQFVERMFENAVTSGVQACVRRLQKPSGRSPHPSKVEESEWFNHLPATDKAFVQRCMARAAEMALFSVLTILDGVSSVENIGPKGEFKLYFEKDGNSTLLNPSTGLMLHDLMPQKQDAR